jgi:hypothetical protein
VGNINGLLSRVRAAVHPSIAPAVNFSIWWVHCGGFCK